jgi:peptidoglycan/LPS O-acetylase OafA/YrhL
VGGVSAARRSISGFDGLRAIAALTVLSYHVALRSGLTRSGWFAPALWELKCGVAMFFVISGALLYLPYARALRDGSRLPDWRSYGRRRAVRILPAYWVAVTVVGIGPFHVAVFGLNAWRYYGLSQIYTPETLLGGLSVAWSLCVEISFYLALPLFAWLAAHSVGRRRGGDAARVQLALIAIAGVGSLVLRGALSGTPTAPVNGTLALVALPGLLDWFAIGMGLAVLRASVEARGPSNVGVLVGRPGRCVLLGLGVFAAALPLQQSDAFVPWYGLLAHIAIGVGCGLLVLSVLTPRPDPTGARSRRLVSHPLLVWVGTISYGIYLWHLPVLQLIAPHLMPAAGSASAASVALTWLGVVLAAVAVGAASWYLIERPVQRLFASRTDGQHRPNPRGRVSDIDAGVHSTLDPLNSPGVVVDHLA